MALDRDSRLYRGLGERRAAKLPKPVTGEELRASAREAIPRVVEKKADQYRSGGEDITLLIITNGSLSAEEMAQLTEPRENCFHAILSAAFTGCRHGVVARGHVVPIIGKYRLAQLNRPIIEQYRDDLINGAVPDGCKRSRVMARKALTALKAAIKEAQRRGKVAQNVASEVQIKRNRDEDDRRKEIGIDVPDKAEVRAILDSAPSRWRPLIITTVFCGLRSSELRGLAWDHVDFDQRLIRVRRRADRWGEMGPPKSKAGRRDVPMAPIVVNVLREWKLACPRGELRLVFPTPTGTVMDHAMVYRRCFGDVQRACGIVMHKRNEAGEIVLDPRTREPVMVPKYGPHSFRHFCASWLIEQGFGPTQNRTAGSRCTRREDERVEAAALRPVPMP
jgi:integrase